MVYSHTSALDRQLSQAKMSRNVFAIIKMHNLVFGICCPGRNKVYGGLQLIFNLNTYICAVSVSNFCIHILKCVQICYLFFFKYQHNRPSYLVFNILSTSGRPLTRICLDIPALSRDKLPQSVEQRDKCVTIYCSSIDMTWFFDSL